jgi:hypothetical protein
VLGKKEEKEKKKKKKKVFKIKNGTSKPQQSNRRKISKMQKYSRASFIL